MISGALLAALSPLAWALAGPVAGTVLFAAAFVVLLLPGGVSCPSCGHMIVMPARGGAADFRLVLYVPTRRCRQCGHDLEAPR
jgi:hypothetical protein